MRDPVLIDALTLACLPVAFGKLRGVVREVFRLVIRARHNRRRRPLFATRDASKPGSCTHAQRCNMAALNIVFAYQQQPVYDVRSIFPPIKSDITKPSFTPSATMV